MATTSWHSIPKCSSTSKAVQPISQNALKRGYIIAPMIFIGMISTGDQSSGKLKMHVTMGRDRVIHIASSLSTAAIHDLVAANFSAFFSVTGSPYTISSSL